MLNWDHFRLMIAVADSGSVSRAANLLRVSHATVLRGINRLEQELQIRLFDHSKTGYKLTSDGVDILENARNMENDVQRVLRKAKGRDSVPNGLLNVVIPDASLFNIMPLFRNFKEAYEQISINIRPAQITQPDDFTEQQVDVAIMISNDPPDALVGRQLARIRFGAFVHPHYQSNSGQVTDWITWSLASDDGDHMLSSQKQLLQQLGGAEKVVLNAPSHHDALQAVRAGMGASFLASEEVDDDLIEIPLPRRNRDWGIWMLTHPDFRNSARVSVLMRFLADHFHNNQ